jgi:chromate transporter
MPARAGDDGHVTRWSEVFGRFLRLGLTSFGGPVAHFGYFRREFVERAHWLDDATFAEIVALCSVLPGPTSSQVGITIGWRRAGIPGALLAWFGFTAPSALALGALGLILRAAHAFGTSERPHGMSALPGALDALAGTAAAVVALAVIQLARSLAATRVAGANACAAFVLALGIGRVAPAMQWTPLLLGALLGARFGQTRVLPLAAPPLHISRRAGATAGVLFVVMLACLSTLAGTSGYVALAATFARAGSLVFGGGHVVLPFLQSLIGPGRVDAATFFAGYGAAQAVPGPLFTFAAFLGAVDASVPNGTVGALVALLSVFAPSFLLLAAAIPLWSKLRSIPRAGAVLAGINAAVVGLLAAVLVDPIGFSLARNPPGIVAAVASLGLLQFAKWPPWAVVLACAAAGAGYRLQHGG